MVTYSEDHDFLEELRQDFVLEAEEYLQGMVEGLLDLEQHPSSSPPEVLESVFRGAHSLKGASQAVELPAIAAICQAMESIFSQMKKGLLQLGKEDFDLLQEGADLLGELIAAKPEKQDRPKAEALAERMEKLLKTTDPLGVPPPPPRIVLRDEGPLEERSPEEEPERLLPEETSQDHGKRKQDEEIQEAASREEPFESSPPRSSQETPPALHSQSSSEMIRIRASKMDALLLEAEELISLNLALRMRHMEVQEMVTSLGIWKKEWERFLQYEERSEQKENPLSRERKDFLRSGKSRMGELQETLRHLRKALQEDQRRTRTLVHNLLDRTRSVLMVPFSSLLQGFPKIFRDLSRDLGKEAELFILGGDVEVDKRILEGLKDPLIHLLRNCVDHGLESPEIRREKGKRPLGSVAIQVSQVDGNRVELVIQDDGKGIDAAKLRESAVKAGALAPREAQALDDHEAQMLLFRSGISTSSLITDISGRGLGMAIVQQKVEALGGSISLESTPDRGTTFRISLPLTLATFRGVLVEEEGQLFVLPSTNVEWVGRIARRDIKVLEQCETISSKGEPVALVSLGGVLELPQLSQERGQREMRTILILSSGALRGAFGVDRVLEEQEVLLKPLGKQLQRIRNISGATVLGSGKVVPVLNPTDLLLSLSKKGGAGLSAEFAEEKPLPRILVAEDSLTSRTLLRNILSASGFEVETAVDGQEAWEKLQSGGFDLVISDVEMPRKNGFELTAAIRSSFQELPVILVTSLESREDRERGAEAGANAYIIKSGFDQSNLLDAIRRLL
jgi:two-component system chemotaxis sensor kinase CheA